MGAQKDLRGVKDNARTGYESLASEVFPRLASRHGRGVHLSLGKGRWGWEILTRRALVVYSCVLGRFDARIRRDVVVLRTDDARYGS